MFEPKYTFKDKEVLSQLKTPYPGKQFLCNPCRIHFVHNWFFVFFICSLSFWLMTTVDNCFYLGSQHSVIKLSWWLTKDWNCMISRQNEVGFLSVRFPNVQCTMSFVAKKNKISLRLVCTSQDWYQKITKNQTKIAIKLLCVAK